MFAIWLHWGLDANKSGYLEDGQWYITPWRERARVWGSRESTMRELEQQGLRYSTEAVPGCLTAYVVEIDPALI